MLFVVDFQQSGLVWSLKATSTGRKKVAEFGEVRECDNCYNFQHTITMYCIKIYN